MKIRFSAAVVGAFVIGAFALGLIALLSFGGVSLFHKPQRFVVYFDESINGLDLGSPVKLRGVRVGRVVDMNVLFDERRKRSVVRVVCEFNRNKITDADHQLIDVRDRTVLKALVNKGLRAQLGIIGLATGLLYVELDFLDPHEFPNESTIADSEYVVVPAVPSAISEIQTNLTDILTKLNRVDFAGLTRELQGLLADTHRKLDALQLEPMVQQWTKAAKSVNAVASSPQLKETLANLNGAVIDLRGLLTRLNQQVAPTGRQFQATLAETRRTLATFNEAAETLRKFIAAQRDLGTDANQALTKLAAAADAVQRLASFLERNPQALISGRSRRHSP